MMQATGMPPNLEFHRNSPGRKGSTTPDRRVFPNRQGRYSYAMEIFKCQSD